MLKRVAIVILAAWVLFSANAWPHSPANRVNAAVVGAGLLYFGALSIRHEWARFATLAFGIWLFAFTVLSGGDSAITYWNNAMVALVVFILSVVGGEGQLRALRWPAGG
jgi:hypothetical protein